MTMRERGLSGRRIAPGQAPPRHALVIVVAPYFPMNAFAASSARRPELIAQLAQEPAAMPAS